MAVDSFHTVNGVPCKDIPLPPSCAKGAQDEGTAGLSRTVEQMAAANVLVVGLNRLTDMFIAPGTSILPSIAPFAHEGGRGMSP